MAFPFESSIVLTNAACQLVFASTTTYIEESSSNVLDFVANSTLHLRINSSGITLNSGASVNTIETTLTDDDTHIPTSGAVVDYCAGLGDVSWGTPTNYYVALGDSVSGNIASASTLSYSASTLNVTGDVVATGDVRAYRFFESTDTATYLTTSGTGNVYIRPGGPASSTGETTFGTSTAGFTTNINMATSSAILVLNNTSGTGDVTISHRENGTVVAVSGWDYSETAYRIGIGTTIDTAEGLYIHSGYTMIQNGGYLRQTNVDIRYDSTRVIYANSATASMFLQYNSGNGTATGLYNFGAGGGAGTALTSGAYNILIGYNAGNTLTTGSYNVLLGYEQDVALGDNYIFKVGYSTTTAISAVLNTGAVTFDQYGAGTNTGTATYALAVDASGNVIEETLGTGNVTAGSTLTQYAVVTGNNGTDIVTPSGTTVGFQNCAIAGVTNIQVVTGNAVYPSITSSGSIGNSTHFWENGYIETLHVGLYTTSASVGMDGSNNLYFTDSVTGTVTLADLSSGSSIWTSDTNGITYSSGNVGINVGSSSEWNLMVNGSIRYNQHTPLQMITGNNNYFYKLGTLTGQGSKVRIKINGGTGYSSAFATYTEGFVSIGNADDEYMAWQYTVGNEANNNCVIIYKDEGTSTSVDVYVRLGTYFIGSVEIIEGDGFTYNSSAGTPIADPSGVTATDLFDVRSDFAVDSRVAISTTIDTASNLIIGDNSSTDHVVKIDANTARGASRYALYIDDEDSNSRGALRIETAGSLPFTAYSATTATMILEGASTTASTGALLRMIGSSSVRARGIQFERGDGTPEWFCGVGYNISDNFTIGYDATTGQPEYSAASFFRIHTGGYMSIGAGPNSGYTLYIDNAQSGSNVTLGLDRTSGQPTIKALGDTYMIIDSNGNYTSINHYVTDNVHIAIGGGNVGIGVAPSYKLHVSGTAYITSSLRLGGTTLTSGYILELSGTSNKGRAADWTATSDVRLKTNIHNYGSVLCGIMSLNNRSEYGLSLYNRRILDDEGRPTDKFNKEIELGYIAQDMMKVFPSVVNGSEKEFYDISYMRLGAIALAGVAELKDEKDREIEELRTRVSKLETKLAKYGDNNN